MCKGILRFLGVVLVVWPGGPVVATSGPNDYAFVTLAGPPEAGKGALDGPGPNARFNAPNGVAVDSTGNLYVADTGNHTIRKITVTGQVATLAGLAGTSGIDNGLGSAARFASPSGVAVDSGGNVYVADTGNHAIRKITPSGLVTTLAGSPGSGNSGFADLTGTAARFNSPSSVAVDLDGNVYVADTLNHRIRKITPLGEVSTFAGNGTTTFADGNGTDATFNSPSGVAVDAARNVYVADASNFRIRRITPSRDVAMLAGGNSGNGDGAGGSAQFNTLRGLAVDSAGNLFVADKHAIRKVTSAGDVKTSLGVVGTPGNADGTGTDARFYSLFGVAVDGGGTVYVADRDNHTIRRITPGGLVTTLAGRAVASGSSNGQLSDARFYKPNGVAVQANGNVYVADTGNQTIRKAPQNGLVTETVAGVADTTGVSDVPGLFNGPYGVAVDASGVLFVADYNNHAIRVVDSGRVSTLAGWPGTSGDLEGTGTGARFKNPSGVAVDGSGNVYVADTGNNKIRLVTWPGGVMTTFAGTGAAGNADGPGNNALFSGPRGIAVDSQAVYVADATGQVIRKIRIPDRSVTTMAGMYPVAGSVDGIGNVARFNSPSGVAVDTGGNVYVADFTSRLVRKIGGNDTAGYTVMTIGGLLGVAGSSDGTGNGACFNGPFGVAVDALGNLYVADSGNHVIRKGFPAWLDQPTLAPLNPSVNQAVQINLNSATANTREWSWVRHPAASVAPLPDPSVANPTFTPDVPDRYILRLKATTASGAVSIRTVQFDALPAPTITVQPQNQSAALGATAQFTVAATGTETLYYVWKKDGVALAEGGRITGSATMTLSIANVSSDDVGNYTVDVSYAARGTAFSQPASLTASLTVLTVLGITAADKTYDGTTSAAIDTSSATLHGVLSGDAVTLVKNGASGSFADKNVGTGKTVTITGLSLSGLAAAKYTLTQPTTTANITPLGLTVTGITAANKVYDGATSTAISTGSATLNGVLSADAGKVSLVTAGATGSFADRNVCAGKTVTISGLTMTGDAAVNYALTPPTATADIIRKTLVLTGLTANDKVYDGTLVATLSGTPALLAAEAAGEGTPSDGKPYLGDAVTLAGAATGAFARKNAATAVGVIVSGKTLTGDQAASYLLAADEQSGLTANITRAPLTVMADNKGRDFGAGNPPLTATYNGFVSGETLPTSGVTGDPVLTTTATTASEPGSYTITVTQGTLSAGNYSFIFVNGTLTVNSVLPVITTAPQSQTVTPGGEVLLRVTASGADPLTYQWQRNGARVAGANQSTLLLGHVQPEVTGEYRVVVSNGGGSVTSDVAVVGLTSSTSVQFAAGNVVVQPDGEVVVPVSVKDFSRVTTAQFTLHWDPTLLQFAATGNYLPALALDSLLPGGQEFITDTNFGLDLVTAGKLTFSWDSPGGLGITVPDGSVLFSLRCQVVGALDAGATIAFTDDPTPREVSVDSARVGFLGGAGTVGKGIPTLTWANPAAMTYGTPLGDAQLNATATVPGHFVYSPPAGTVLQSGQNQVLSVSFTPDAPGKFISTTAAVTVNVNRATPVLTWANPSDISYGTPLGNLQLNATANVLGALVYSPPAGTILNAGSGQPLMVTFTPTEAANYTTAAKTVTLNVSKPTPVLTWANPADIVYGTALSAAQLNATANVPGTWVYAPAAGTVLDAGLGQSLSVTFTPTDAVHYTTASATVSVNVLKALLTATADNKSRAVGAGNPVLTGTLTGVRNGDNITATFSCEATTGSPAGTYAIAVHLVGPDGKLVNYTLVTNPGTLTVNLAPAITTPPASQTVAAGATVTFTVGVSGTAPFTYQWLFNGTPIPGPTESSLILASVQGDRAGRYSVQVNNVTQEPVTSAEATLTVMHTIAGAIKYHTSELPVPGVVVSLSGADVPPVTTDQTGTYSFTVSATGTYTVCPDKLTDDPISRGVSTLDLHTLRRHILALELLTDPHLILAADANGSGSVTSLDIAYLRRLILGSFSTLPAGLWRFAPADYTFADPSQPWGSPTARQHSHLTADLTGQDFLAIRVGDMNADWAPPLARLSGVGPRPRSAGLKSLAPVDAPRVTFQVGSLGARAGSTVMVPISVAGFAAVTTVQFTLQWDPAVLQFGGVTNFGLSGLNMDSFGTTRTSAGKLMFSWDDPAGIGTSLPDGAVLFTLRFTVLAAAGASSTITFSDDPTPREVTVNTARVAMIGEAGKVVVAGPGPETPLVLQPALASSPGAPMVFNVSVPTVAGKVYVLEATDSLVLPRWQPVTQITGDGSVRALTDSITADTKRFYRVRSP